MTRALELDFGLGQVWITPYFHVEKLHCRRSHKIPSPMVDCQDLGVIQVSGRELPSHDGLGVPDDVAGNRDSAPRQNVLDLELKWSFKSLSVALPTGLGSVKSPVEATNELSRL